MNKPLLNAIEQLLKVDASLSPADKEFLLTVLQSPSEFRLQLESNQPHEPIEYLTTAAVADILKVNVRTIQRWIADGKLKSRKLNGCRRILSSDIRKMEIIQFPALMSMSGGRNLTPDLKTDMKFNKAS